MHFGECGIEPILAHLSTQRIRNKKIFSLKKSSSLHKRAKKKLNSADLTWIGLEIVTKEKRYQKIEKQMFWQNPAK